MNDGPSSLLQQWSILIQGFIEEDIPQKSKEQILSFEEIKAYSRHLSQRRKALNKQIEDIKASIEEKNLTLENLILVKSETAEILAAIEDLNQQGESLSQALTKLDQKARSLRIAEALFFAESKTA